MKQIINIDKYIKEEFYFSELVKNKEKKIDWIKLIEKEDIEFNDIIKYTNYFDINNHIFFNKYFIEILESFLNDKNSFFDEEQINSIINLKKEYSLKEFSMLKKLNDKLKNIICSINDNSLFIFEYNNVIKEEKDFFIQINKSKKLYKNLINESIYKNNKFYFDIAYKSFENETLKYLFENNEFLKYNLTSLISLINISKIDLRNVNTLFKMFFEMKIDKEKKKELLKYVENKDFANYIKYGYENVLNNKIAFSIENYFYCSDYKKTLKEIEKEFFKVVEISLKK